ncbi:hypothetical protein [Martelella mediterranea]|uniref:Fido domain-containing protein n=1 Tax=Martelella mediterranea TaxID=293089 RepID=A0A4R3NUW8_9HYPH|nr:hypothetical protein [Martelella mediterranea]TCT40347.1 hypothetical protein EDC90_100969 [Martelella mediterranea]
MFKHSLDLKKIEAKLRDTQRQFDRINAMLTMRRDGMPDTVIEHMMEGYAYINGLLNDGVDLLHIGEFHHLLELNHLVLCGSDPKARAEFSNHILRTEEHFYDRHYGDIGGLVDWYNRHLKKPVRKRAAGIYVRVLSRPQLFIEGNHRTGALIMSYILCREGKPPFVLTPENAEAYFNPSTLVRDSHKYSMDELIKIPKLSRYFANFLKENEDDGLVAKSEELEQA